MEEMKRGKEGGKGHRPPGVHQPQRGRRRLGRDQGRSPCASPFPLEHVKSVHTITTYTAPYGGGGSKTSPRRLKRRSSREKMPSSASASSSPRGSSIIDGDHSSDSSSNSRPRHSPRRAKHTSSSSGVSPTHAAAVRNTTKTADSTAASATTGARARISPVRKKSGNGQHKAADSVFSFTDEYSDDNPTSLSMNSRSAAAISGREGVGEVAGYEGDASTPGAHSSETIAAAVVVVVVMMLMIMVTAGKGPIIVAW